MLMPPDLVLAEMARRLADRCFRIAAAFERGSAQCQRLSDWFAAKAAEYRNPPQQ